MPARGAMPLSPLGTMSEHRVAAGRGRFETAECHATLEASSKALGGRAPAFSSGLQVGVVVFGLEEDGCLVGGLGWGVVEALGRVAAELG